jgi:DNA-binding transcriptional ArsR family regulator
MATDAQHSLPIDGGLWITVAELAQRKGLTRQTVAERVNRLEEEGRISTRREGRSRLVELAAYDRAVGAVGDAAKEIGAQTKRDEGSSENSGLRDAQTERAKYEARLKALDFAERSGLVIPVKGENGIEGALIKICDQVLRDLGTPMQWVDDLMEASRKGEPHLRRVIRTKIAEQRKLVAEHLMALAGEAAQAEADGVNINIHFDGDE